MEVPKQKDIRNEQPELELFPEEAPESPEQGQSEKTAEKEPEGKSIGERAIRNEALRSGMRQWHTSSHTRRWKRPSGR